MAVRVMGAAVALTLVFCVLGWALGAHFAPGELALIARLVQIRNGALTVLAKSLTTVGSLLVLGPLAVLTALWCTVRRRGTAVFVVVGAAAGVVAIGNVVKLVVHRPRPMTLQLVEVSTASFPSLHAAQAAAILPAVAIVLTAPGRTRALAVAVAGVLVVGSGLSRVYLGVHYPSDVAAGWVLGLVWLGCMLHIRGTSGERAHPPV
ncbi:MAG: phosphatase PAP2 family protein [Mycobacteriaceae bacterium]